MTFRPSLSVMAFDTETREERRLITSGYVQINFSMEGLSKSYVDIKVLFNLCCSLQYFAVLHV